MGNLETIIASLSALLAVIVICAAFTYGCTTTNRQYYAAWSECVQAGGSAIPATGSNGIICLIK